MRKFLLSFLTVCLVYIFTGCSENTSDNGSGFKSAGSMELKYATQFSADYLADGSSLVSIADGNRYLIIPENNKIPDNLEKDIVVIRKSPETVYLAASSAMDFFIELSLADHVQMTSTRASDWCIPEIRERVENEDTVFVGKYSTPDYEYLLSEGCDIAIESTMIYHSPEVKEMLMSLGIPVLIERSSYEAHPLGRMEWIKLYGLLYGMEEEAEKFFSEKCSAVERLTSGLTDGERKTVAFFSISSNGYINVRKPDDYVSEMIRLAGGEYIFTAEDLGTEENALSTMNIQTETFYEKARDADILIYNAAIDGGMETVSGLTAKASVLKEFKAVQNGNVWCSEKSMFQKTTGAAEMINDLHEITALTDKNRLTYFFRLRQDN